MRNQSLDSIKIIAMCGVLILHTTVEFHLGSDVISHTLFSMAGISMPLFFMVSGYLMLNRGKDYQYFIPKIFNIVKFVCLITLILDIITLGADFRLKTWAFDFIGVFFKLGRYGILWYFSAISFLYLLTPLLDKLHRKSQFGFYSLLVSCLLVSSIMQDSDIAYNFEIKILQPFRVWYWISFFMIGGTIRKWIEKQSSNMICSCSWTTMGGKMLIICALYILYIFYFCMLKGSLGQYGIEYMFGTLPCLLLALSVFVSVIRLQICDNRIIKEVSALFLPVYAIHMPLIRAVKPMLPNFDNLNSSLQSLILYTFIIIGVLTVSWLLMKTPILKKLFRI